MNRWKFRSFVRQNFHKLGKCCPLGCHPGIELIVGSIPTPDKACEWLGVSFSYAYGVARGWDGKKINVTSHDQVIGERFGRRIRRVYELSKLT